MVARGAVRRHLPLALSVAGLLAAWMVPVSAQPGGGAAPAPVVTLFANIDWIVIYLVCPTVALVLVVSALATAAAGHHGTQGIAAIKVFCAVCLIGISVVMSWLHF